MESLVLATFVMQTKKKFYYLDYTVKLNIDPFIVRSGRTA